MTDRLLDANVLIAMVVAEHEHHHLVTAWLAALPADDRMALCPMVEGAFVRYLVRAGVPASAAAHGAAMVRARPQVVWLADDVSYADVDLTAVRGHRQVTDAYLVGLVTARGDAVLATLDRALAATWPGRTVLISG